MCSIHTFNQITGGHTISPRQAAIANDHFVFTGKSADGQWVIKSGNDGHAVRERVRSIAGAIAFRRVG